MSGNAHRHTAAILGLALACGVLAPGRLPAQQPLRSGTLYQKFVFGSQDFVNQPDFAQRAWFERYRDVPSGMVLESADLWWVSSDELARVEFRAREAGQEDQSFALSARRLGSWRVEVGRNQTPHAFSSTSRMLANRTSPGVFTLPEPRPALASFNDGGVLGLVGLRWDTNYFTAKLEPRVDWVLQGSYTRTHKRGDRPIGTSFGPGQLIEVLEPIDQTVHDIRLVETFVRPRFRVQLSYQLNAFENDVAALVVDNPLIATDTPTSGSSRGRTALAPSNIAHMAAVTASASLPGRTRVNGTLSYGWRRQDERILPWTINSAIVTDTLPSPPSSLDGDIRSVLYAVSVSSRPVMPLALTARFRSYELDNRTPEWHTRARVSYDRSVSAGDFLTPRFSYTRRSAALDARWQILAPLAVRAGYDWEQWDRVEERDVGTTNEYTPRVALDLGLGDRVMVRGSYSHSRRRGDGYHAHPLVGELPLLRRFDMADRDRDRASLSAEVTPLDWLDLGMTYALGRRDYPESTYGLLSDDETSVVAEVGLHPSDRFMLFASYVHEDFEAEQRSRYRGPPAQLENLTYDWLANTDETIRTWGAGGTIRIIPEKLDLTLAWDLSRGTSRTTSRNPETPTGGTTSQNTAATAVDFPEVHHKLNPAQAFARYRFAQNWVATVGFRMEKYDETDFRTDRLLPYGFSVNAPGTGGGGTGTGTGPVPGTGNDIYLGNRLDDYDTSYVTFSLNYSPFVRGVRRAPM